MLLFFGFIISTAFAQSSTPERNGVFRYDIINLTTREVSVADGRQIVFGPYRAYFRVFPFGTGPAGFYEEREPQKDFRLMHTVRGLVGKYRDLSVDYRERWENPDKLVITHQGQGSPEPQQIRRILTRVPTETSEWDGVWTREVKDLTTDTVFPGEQVWLRYGDYIGFFWQAPGKSLYAVYAKQEEKNRFLILFSSREEEVGTYLDHTKDYQGAWDGDRWVESYVDSTPGSDSAGHGMRVTYEAILK
jgi:hypothetical protein